MSTGTMLSGFSYRPELPMAFRRSPMSRSRTSSTATTTRPTSWEWRGTTPRSVRTGASSSLSCLPGTRPTRDVPTWTQRSCRTLVSGAEHGRPSRNCPCRRGRRRSHAEGSGFRHRSVGHNRRDQHRGRHGVARTVCKPGHRHRDVHPGRGVQREHGMGPGRRVLGGHGSVASRSKNQAGQQAPA